MYSCFFIDGAVAFFLFRSRRKCLLMRSDFDFHSTPLRQIFENAQDEVLVWRIARCKVNKWLKWLKLTSDFIGCPKACQNIRYLQLFNDIVALYKSKYRINKTENCYSYLHKYLIKPRKQFLNKQQSIVNQTRALSMEFLLKNDNWPLYICLNLLKIFGFLVPGPHSAVMERFLRGYWFFWFAFLVGEFCY